MADPPAAWLSLRRFTPARVALGRAGNGLPTAALLAFQAAHAAARDAVHAALDLPALALALEAAGMPGRVVRSQCPDRATFLLRPDLGRRLLDADRALLPPEPGCLAVLLCDGLSAAAAQRHALPVLLRLVPALRRSGWTVAPPVLAAQGRVALGDPVGAALGARAVLVLLGERPGLSAPDSLGAYVTWEPRPGRTDAERNCVSNIRPEGLSPAAAADKILWLLTEMRRLGRSGVALKDEQPAAALPPPGTAGKPGLPGPEETGSGACGPGG